MEKIIKELVKELNRINLNLEKLTEEIIKK